MDPYLAFLVVLFPRVQTVRHHRFYSYALHLVSA